ncbi:MAG: DUF2341 domain-containing protein [Chitinispirillaceae bacterium]|nr:DUF2341 domain-containing protein [Chitinispirillaceae bacterium]
MRRLRTPFLTLLALGIACSLGDRIAGSKGGSETTNGVTACIHHLDGTPAAGSVVRLRRADYIREPAALFKTTLNSADMITDPQGRFSIANIEPGDYCIEVNDTATGEGRGGALLFICSLDTNTLDLGTDSLHPYAAIAGIVDTEDVGGGELFVQLRGLERLVKVNPAGTFVFYDLPAGELEVRIVEGGSTSATEREIVNVTTSPGDTVVVRVSGTFAYSGSVYFNASAAGIPVSGTIVDFPLLVRLDASTFDFSQALPGGEDVRFTKSDGTSLPFEIEQWDAEAQNAAVWVVIDTVYGNTADQHIIMKWGDSAAVDRSNGAAVFDTARGFAGVWHLNEDPASGAGAVKDRTFNGFNGTPNGSMTSNSVVAGMIGEALRFDGVDDYIAAGRLNLIGNYTMSLWINAADLATARRFIWKEYSYTLWYDAIAGGIRVEHFAFEDSVVVWRGIYQDSGTIISLNTSTWYHLAATYDGDRIRLYINGEPADSTGTIGIYPVSSKQSLSLGGRADEYVKGVMDEVRIENRARPAEWIRLCYLSQRPGGIVAEFRRQ